MAPDIPSVKGTRDFYPEDMAVRNWIAGVWRNVSTRYGFEEFDGPIFESLELYTRKSGEEIVSQLYSFDDKGGRTLALRPEMTPTLARMVISRAGTLRKPLKWYSISRCCRYERPQRGRFREFFQWNIDIIGVKEPTADAEVIAASVDSLRDMGLGPADIAVRIGDRKLLAALLSSLGITQGRQIDVYTTIDRMAKLPPEKGRQLLSELDLGRKAEEKILAATEAKGIDEVRELAQHESNTKEAFAELDTLFALFSDYGIADFCELDLSVVRGLDYYTGIVFEIYDKGRELRAICGGGRYDALISTFGGPPMPAAGFGLGDAVIQELLAEKGLLPKFARAVDFFAVPITKDEIGIAARIVQALRQKGRHAEYSLSPGSMRKLMREADNSGAKWTIIVGPDEIKEGAVALRDMETGVQRKVPLEDALKGEFAC